MKVRYVGHSGSGADVVHPDPHAPDASTVTHCAPSETVDLPDDVALEQMATGNFERADTKGRARPRQAAPRRRQRSRAEPTTEAPAEPGTQED